MAGMTTPLAGAASAQFAGTAPAQFAGTAVAQLEADGVATVVGTVVNPAGLTHAKTVPIRRTNAFADPGLGASPVWHGFVIDRAGIAFADDFSCASVVSIVVNCRVRVSR